MLKKYNSIRLKEETYLHINNGGVIVKMEYDEAGNNCLKISASHMAAKTNEMKIPITKSALRAIILDLVDEIADWEYNGDEYSLQANATEKVSYGDVARVVANIIGYPDKEVKNVSAQN